VASLARPDIPPLSCRTLALPEQIAVWLLRRAFQAGVDATSRSARQVFGPARMSLAMQALDGVVTALHRSPLDVPPVHSLDDPTLSREEFDLLTALARAQHAGSAEAETLVARWGWPTAGDDERLARAVDELGALMAHAGQMLPPPHSRPGLATAEVLETAGLDPRERLLVDGIRLWVRCLIHRREAQPQVAALLGARGLAAAALPLHAVLTHTSVAATRSIDVRCRRCPHLSPDEARVLHGVSAVQRDQATPGFELLSSWLPPTAVRLTLPALQGIGRALAAAGHRLPLREWRFPELCGQSSWPVQGATATTAVH